jgi:hypothetical protein
MKNNKNTGAVLSPSLNENNDNGQDISVNVTFDKEKLNGQYVTGFVDAEGTFVVKISKSNKYKTGWRVDPVFEIGLNVKDLALLVQIKGFFGVGTIRMNTRNNAAVYAVQSMKELVSVIIPHFIKYPLVTSKRADFELFKLAVDIMSRKEHLKPEGLQAIINLRASINNGLTDNLKYSFPNTKPILRPEFQFTGVTDPN